MESIVESKIYGCNLNFALKLNQTQTLCGWTDFVYNNKALISPLSKFWSDTTNDTIQVKVNFIWPQDVSHGWTIITQPCTEFQLVDIITHLVPVTSAACIDTNLCSFCTPVDYDYWS